ncbi:MAG: efflux transporter periplasmic adaptor subunit, partial [Candidatus Omnitrophota bacterium]
MKRDCIPALIFALLLTGGCGKKSPGGGPSMPPQETGVATLATQKAEIVTELPGRTAACRIAEVRPQVSGIILKRLFAEGAEVKLGEQL